MWFVTYSAVCISWFVVVVLEVSQQVLAKSLKGVFFCLLLFYLRPFIFEAADHELEAILWLERFRGLA